MKITCTNGNSTNGISGSRITIKNDKNEIIDRFIVPAHNGKKYCQTYPNGLYGKRYFAAIKIAQEG